MFSGASLKSCRARLSTSFCKSRLFAPLHMVDSGFSVPQDKLARLVAVPGAQPQPPFANSDVGKPQTFFSGGGGIVSTVPDFLRFCQMLLNGGELDGVRILKPETVRLMTTNSLPPDMHIAGHEVGPAFGTGWGLGFAVRTRPGFQLHSGRGRKLQLAGKLGHVLLGRSGTEADPDHDDAAERVQ